MGFISFFPIFDFNPHSHEGSDERKSMGMAKKLSISIHTPTKGATFVGGFPFSSSGLFQSTLPRRERLKHILMDSRSLGFQSTLPRRERLPFLRLCDDHVQISIHTPTKGATCLKWYRYLLHKFQSTLPRRERRRYESSNNPNHDFNPHSHEGSDYVL